MSLAQEFFLHLIMTSHEYFYNIESNVYYFRNIYLGEIFSSYLCVHNGSNQTVKNVTVKVSLNYVFFSLYFI